jgi:hypothetical protein
MNKAAEFEKFLTWWNEILKKWHPELSKRLTDLQLSALYSCIPDCFKSMYEIYYEIIPAIVRTPPEDYTELHDKLFDIGGLGGALDHIQRHSADAQPGFLELFHLLAEKADEKEKK